MPDAIHQTLFEEIRFSSAAAAGCREEEKLENQLVTELGCTRCMNGGSLPGTGKGPQSMNRNRASRSSGNKSPLPLCLCGEGNG
jgi:hypothetical protein